MVGPALAKRIYAVPTWTRTVALVSEHPALRAANHLRYPDAVRIRLLQLTTKPRTYGDMLTCCIHGVFLSRLTTSTDARHTRRRDKWNTRSA
jgi:hypothetical protein